MKTVLLEQLLRYVSEAVIVLNPDHVITEFTGSAETIFGWTRDEAVGRNLLSDFSWSFAEDGGVRSWADVPDREHVRIQSRRKDGLWMDLDVSLTSMHVGNHSECAWLLLVRDVTAEVEERRLLQEQQAELIAYFKSPAFGLAVTDSADRFIRVNDTLCSMLGYSESQLLGRTFMEFTHPADRALHVANLRDLEAGRLETFTFEKRYLTARGSVLWVVVSCSMVVTDDGRTLGRIAIIRDITGRKQAEAQVKTLSGFLPICARCKKIRDDRGYWEQIEASISTHSDAQFSHGLCPECMEEYFPGIMDPEP
jgi:PAS domain S-box-containing protein